MSFDCPICSSSLKKCFDAVLLGRHRVDYFYCDACGLLRTEKPYWLQEAYSEAISSADTGLVARNLALSNRLTTLLYFLFNRQARYLDIAGGTGLLTRMMRDIGFDFYWRDSYCRNVHARGFEFSSANLPCKAVTAFEVLEHVEDPIGFITDALKESGADTFIFTTEFFAGQPPEPGHWWYYAPETGQHICFYQRRTFESIAQRLGCFFYTHAGIHAITKRKLPVWVFRLSVGRFGRRLAPILRRNLDSKMMSDHVDMLKRTTTASQLSKY